MLWLLSSLPAAVEACAASADMPAPAIEALADPTEPVREVALRAGQMIAKTMTTSQGHVLCGYFCEGVFQDCTLERLLELLGEVLEVLAAERAARAALLMTTVTVSFLGGRARGRCPRMTHACASPTSVERWAGT